MSSHEINDLLDENTELRQENARLREALEHYANRMSMGGTARRALEWSEG